MAADWNNLQSVYGLDQATINGLQKSGYSADQASQLLNLSVGSQQTSPGINVSTIGGSGLSPQILAGLANILGKGGGGGASGQDQSGGGLRNYQSVGVDPNQPLTNLGAAALQQNAVYNPQPGAGGISQVSGVSNTQPAISTSGVVPNVQQGPWTRTPGMFLSATGAVTPGTQIAPQLKPGQQPTQQDPNYKGPIQITMPSAFGVPQPTAPLPVTPTPQATGVPYTPGKSWATPPPAPGLSIGGGGGAVPMPMGGGGGAAPMPMGGGQPGGAQVPPSGGGVAGSAVALGTAKAPAPTSPIKRFAAGGVVTQPTLAMVGEQGPEAIVPLGGQNQLTPEQIAYIKNQRRSQSLQSVPSLPPPAPTGQQSQQKPGAIYDAQGNVVDSSPGLTAQAVGGRGATMDPSGAVRDASGNIFTSDANLTAQAAGGSGATMPGGGAASGATTGGAGAMGNAIGGAIGSIGGALQSALSNVPSWKIQPSAIPDPSSFTSGKQQQEIQLQQHLI